jgi:hypothetical protein
LFHWVFCVAIACMLLFPVEAVLGQAGNAVVGVVKQGDGQFRFDVMVRHADEGWER